MGNNSSIQPIRNILEIYDTIEPYSIVIVVPIECACLIVINLFRTLQFITAEQMVGATIGAHAHVETMKL